MDVDAEAKKPGSRSWQVVILKCDEPGTVLDGAAWRQEERKQDEATRERVRWTPC